MDIRNHRVVRLVVPALAYDGPAAVRAGVATFVFRGGGRMFAAAAATIASEARQVSVAPIEDYDVDSRPFLQATILAF